MLRFVFALTLLASHSVFANQIICKNDNYKIEVNLINHSYSLYIKSDRNAIKTGVLERLQEDRSELMNSYMWTLTDRNDDFISVTSNDTNEKAKGTAEILISLDDGDDVEINSLDCIINITKI